MSDHLMNDLREAIKSAIPSRYSNLNAFAKAAGVDRGNLHKFLEEDKSMNISTFLKIFPKVGWSLSKHPEVSETSCDSEYAFVPMVEAVASAGGGSLESSGEVSREIVFRRTWLNGRVTGVNNLRAWKVAGDSMEPVIAEGGIVLIDEGITKPERGKIYVARVRGELFIKEYQGRDVGKDVWISRNQNYRPMEIDLEGHEDYKVIGRVVWTGREL
jgi:phage repressor protein C with HTH and peptisase S24 domain